MRKAVRRAQSNSRITAGTVLPAAKRLQISILVASISWVGGLFLRTPVANGGCACGASSTAPLDAGGGGGDGDEGEGGEDSGSEARMTALILDRCEGVSDEIIGAANDEECVCTGRVLRPEMLLL